MPRHIVLIDPEAIPDALAYLARATERRSKVFVVGQTDASARLPELNKLQATPSNEVGPVFNGWLYKYLTPEGRVRMLDTLRRKRNDLVNTREKRRAITLPADTMNQLQELCKQLGGMPLPELLTAFASIGLSDKELRKKLLVLAVAISIA